VNAAEIRVEVYCHGFPLTTWRPAAMPYRTPARYRRCEGHKPQPTSNQAVTAITDTRHLQR
jgi:hypothetical protein